MLLAVANGRGAGAATFPFSSTVVPRTISYAALGACLAQGSAAGLLFVRLLRRRQFSLASATQEVGDDLATYAYIAGATTLVFSLFGSVVGRYTDRLAALATTDALTGLLNARAFHQRVREEIVRANRYAHPLSILMVDLDGLKRVNDRHGHAAGDIALGEVADAIRGTLREADLSARLGGDEFAVLAPNTTAASALVFAERLRARLSSGDGRQAWAAPTVSIGIASLETFEPAPPAVSAVLQAADRALYRAKRGGGNRAAI